MIKYFRALTLAVVAATLVTAAGCSSTKDNAPAPAANKAPDKVTYVTAFGAVGRDAFAWVAQEKGYFADANLDVKIQLGAAVDQNLSALAADHCRVPPARAAARGVLVLAVRRLA